MSQNLPVTTEAKKQAELSPIHDFASKLCQPEVLPRLKDYVRWQAKLRGTLAHGEGPADTSVVPDYAPLSINLDITTACNYACDHCVDMEILNQAIKYNHENLMDSIRVMASKGLKSVIVIGGGEPTLYPRFSEAMRFMKQLGLQVAIVSNGTGNKKIQEIADCFTADDWVRLSLDSGTDPTFQAMHKPKRPITLEEICAGIKPVKAVNPRFKFGFSYIVTWKGAFINDTHIVENLHEIVPAARLARDSGFDYISFKPFLTRAEANNAEVVDLTEAATNFDAIIERVQREVAEAKKLGTDTFRVYESTNLKVLQNRSYQSYTRQPETCHMQFFRQVLSPLGLYNCPVYRNQPHGKLGDKEAYSSEALFQATRGRAALLIGKFNAAEQCKEVTCLYNHANWWIEELIESPGKLDALQPAATGEPDYFL